MTSGGVLHCWMGDMLKGHSYDGFVVFRTARLGDLLGPGHCYDDRWCFTLLVGGHA